jgi:nucleotide-binding universal stress UspA family protein
MKILIAYDGSDCAEAALDDLQRAGLPRQAEVLVVTVTEIWVPPPHAESFELLMAASGQPPVIEKAQGFALRAVERLQQNFGEWTVNSRIQSGSPGSAILNVAEEWHPDLIVVGSHGRSAVGRLVLGSVSQKVVTEARCSVRVARGKVEVESAAARLIVGFDGGPGSDIAVDMVASREWPEGSEARVVAVHESLRPSFVGRVMPVVGNWLDEINTKETSWIEAELGKAAEKLRNAGLTVDSRLMEGDPPHVLVEVAREWDAHSIFVGATSHKGRATMFLSGSVSSAVTARAHCSVEVVRSEIS